MGFTSLWAEMRLRIKQDQHGISNVIVVMLGLVILVTIVANVILWSYQMNQLDWEKMQEDISVVNVTRITETWSYNPSEYALGGSTSNVSGSVSDLTSNDGVYMTFRSCYSGTDTSDFIDQTCDSYPPSAKGTHNNFAAQQAGPDSTYDTLTESGASIEDYVDNNTSNMDNSTDVGSHSNFENQKAKDSSYDTLTEDDVGGGTVWLWQEDTGGYGSTSSYETYQFWNSWTTNSTTSGTVTKIGIYVFADPGNSPQVKLGIYDDSGGSPNNLLGETNAATITGAGWLDLDIVGGGVSISTSTTYHVAHITDIAPFTQWRYRKTASPVSDYRTGRVWPNLFDPAGMTPSSSSYRYGAYRVGYDEPSNYRLDQEIQWTSVIDFLSTERLCIYAGILGDEDLRVDNWNGTGWENIATDLTPSSWNNCTVSLTSTTFTIRFNGGNETGDTAQDQWQIDASLLRFEGAGSKEDAVDLQSDVDGSSDVGTHSDFDAMKTKDGYDTLTEENTAGSSNSTLLDDGFETADWDANWDAIPHNWWEDNWHDPHSGSASAWAANGDEGYFTCDNLDASGASAIYVDFWFRKDDTESTDFTLYYYDGSNYHLIDELDNNGPDNTWLHYTEKVTDNQYFVSNFRIRFDATLEGGGPGGEEVWIDDVLIKKEIQIGDNYELDLEVQWTDVPYLLPNENLSIYGGAIGAEDIKVDVWNGTGWETVFTDLSSGWNNVSITDWLTTSNFTIRFKGGTETGDPSQNTWNVDVALIHMWNTIDNCEVNLEVQWTNAAYGELNEELCVKTGTFSGSEDLQVKVRSGGSWVWVMNLTSSQWNNVSVTSYLTGSTFTIQFLGGTETSDSTQDNWDIDVTLLHVWSHEYIMEVEFIGSSNTEDWTQLNWTIDSAWTIGSVDVTLQLYNYTLGSYPTSGNGYMNYTSSAIENTDETKNQIISVNPISCRNATGYWKMKVKGVKTTDTQFDFKADWIEYKAIKAIKAGGTSFTFENTGSLTCHLVSLWIINSTVHQRHDIDVFINSGETYTYIRDDIDLPDGQCTVKVVTERGNTGVYSII
jgi:hypothetical protein